MHFFGFFLSLSAAHAEDLDTIKGYHAKALRTIEASPAEISAIVGDFQTWPDWSAWGKAMDPEALWSFDGTPGAVGQKMAWDGKKVKTGSMTWTAAAPAGPFAYDLTFGDAPKVVAKGRITATPGEGGTVVFWEMAGHMGPIGRALFARKASVMIAADFAKGLEKLEERAEASAAANRAAAKAAAVDRAKAATGAAASATMEAAKRVAAVEGLAAALTTAKSAAASAKKKDKPAAEAAVLAATAAWEKADAALTAAKARAVEAQAAADAATAAAAALPG